MPAGALQTPFDNTYWVEPGRLLAGFYPGDPGALSTRQRLTALLDCGIRTFIDLMEADELRFRPGRFRPYAPEVLEIARERGLEVDCRRYPIEDECAPTPELLEEILGAVDASLAADRPVYLHCWGGRGRTGVVVGCWLIRRGRAAPDSYLSAISALRSRVPGAAPSPQTAEQRAFVRSWAAAAGGAR